MSSFIEIFKHIDPFLAGVIFFIIIIPPFFAVIIYAYFYNPKIVIWDWDEIKDADDDKLTFRKRFQRDAYLSTLNQDKKTKKTMIMFTIAFGVFMEIFAFAMLLSYVLTLLFS